MRVVEVRGGFLIEGDCTQADVRAEVGRITGALPLIIADPPYGNIVDKRWDKVTVNAATYADWMVSWTKFFAEMSLPGAAMYVWGGIGKPHFRPFFHYLTKVEEETPYEIANYITWGKKRAYGVPHNYLFTREELVYLSLGDIKKPRKFEVPLLDVKRGYSGYEQDVIVGYFDGCYHTLEDGFHEDPAHSCLSSGSQASSKRLVYELLRQAKVQLGPGVSQATASKLVREEPGAPPFVHTGAGEEESGAEGARGPSRKRQKTRDSVRLDREGSSGDLDGSVPRVGGKNLRPRQETEQLVVGGSNRQLCWVCTWKHLHHVVESQQTEGGCFDRGAGGARLLPEKATIEDVAIVEKQLKYPAKSEYYRRTNVWTDVTEILRGKVHENQKPEKLAQIMIQVHTQIGEWVFDPFAGSGSTGIAARNIARRFVLVEKDPKEFETCLAQLQA